jgi:hypothetical protein
MKAQKIFFGLILLTFFSFTVLDKKSFDFEYPKQKGTKISLLANHFKRFEKEWRRQDYYYYAEKDGLICSILYYKLNEDEKLNLIENPKLLFAQKFKEEGKIFPENSPAFAFSYFSNYSNLKKMEENEKSWGEMTDDFMFRKNEINLAGAKVIQTHMYGYAMFGDDLFVNIHLSGMNCKEADIKEMEDILSSLKKVKE